MLRLIAGRQAAENDEGSMSFSDPEMPASAKINVI